MDSEKVVSKYSEAKGFLQWEFWSRDGGSETGRSLKVKFWKVLQFIGHDKVMVVTVVPGGWSEKKTIGVEKVKERRVQ